MSVATAISDDLVFKAIANADRRLILDAIHDKARTTGQLCDILDHLDRCTVMMHLKVLEEAGLVIVQREGRNRWNHLDVSPIQAIYSRWIEPYAQPAARLLETLKTRRTSPEPPNQ